MSTKTLHITNGDSLNNWLLTLQMEGSFAVWREMLCEGKTTQTLDKQNFIDTRKAFFTAAYGLGTNDYEDKFISQLEIIKNCNNYDEIILWFEYDLFCHINMMACISYLLQQQCSTPIYLVCSGHIKEETKLKGLSELSEAQLLDHFKERVLLTSQDVQLANQIWKLYCEDDHTLLQPELVKEDSNFIYLQSCIQAHKQRFPDHQSGVNVLEAIVLKTIKEQHLSSERQLCGLILKNQEYYGFGDMQVFKIIEGLRSYFVLKENQLILTQFGENVLSGISKATKNQEQLLYFGGVSKYAYNYQKDTHQLIKA